MFPCLKGPGRRKMKYFAQLCSTAERLSESEEEAYDILKVIIVVEFLIV